MVWIGSESGVHSPCTPGAQPPSFRQSKNPSTVKTLSSIGTPHGHQGHLPNKLHPKGRRIFQHPESIATTVFRSSCLNILDKGGENQHVGFLTKPPSTSPLSADLARGGWGGVRERERERERGQGNTPERRKEREEEGETGEDNVGGVSRRL